MLMGRDVLGEDRGGGEAAGDRSERGRGIGRSPSLEDHQNQRIEQGESPVVQDESLEIRTNLIQNIHSYEL